MFTDIYRSLLSRMFDACVAIFSAALMLYLAVQLIAAVLIWLLVIGGLSLLVAGLIWFVRWRNEIW